MTWPYRKNRAWVYGHRGVRNTAPENTLLAFEHALKKGADGVEFDVQTSLDGKTVVFHDATLERMTKGRDCRTISSVSAIELGSIVLEQGASAPLLQDVLRWANGNELFLNVELKSIGSNLLPLLDAVEHDIREVASPSLQLRILVSSFSKEAISLVNSRGWPWPSAQLLDKDEPLHVPLHASTGLHPHYSLVRGWPVLASTETRFVNVWTVNDAATTQWLNRRGIDGIITDEIETAFSALEA
jgi:glycerophosphoryl diester phosphodiesterase